MIIIGPAGTGTDVLSGMRIIHEKGLGAVEMEFTHGVWMSPEKAEEVKELNKRLGLKLSVHAPYFINLAAKETEKISASKKRILDSCKRAHEMGAGYVVFHPGFLMGRDRKIVHRMIREEMKDLQEQVRKNRWNIVLAPETTGKLSQYGDLDELLSLRKDIGCEICVDFAHIYARNLGHINYGKIIQKLKALPYIHAHFSGIEFTDKGEKRHTKIDEHEFTRLAQALKRSDATIICESPYTMADALKMNSVINISLIRQ